MLDASLDLQMQSRYAQHIFNLSFSVRAEKGRTTVLLGESGSGKTSVLRALAGLIRPESGHIVLDGAVYFDSKQHIFVPPQKRPFGYVFQDYILFPHLSVFENVAFGLRAQRLSRKLVHSRVMTVLEQVRLNGFEQRYPSHLSGGQQQRVAIARALVLQPRLLLLDEPLSALDVQTRREVRHELLRILAEIHVTTVLVTHQYVEALLFGEQILVLEQGHVIQRGDQQSLAMYPRSPYVAELVGINLLQGLVTSSEGTVLYTVTLSRNGASLDLVASLVDNLSSTSRLDTGNLAYVVVDPRNVTLHSSPPSSSARNVLVGYIVNVFYKGNATISDGYVRVTMQIDASPAPFIAEITTASASRMKLVEGQKIYATFKATEARVYA